MEQSIAMQIENHRIAMKRCEMDILKAELEILLITREIVEDKESLKRMEKYAEPTDEQRERHQWNISRRYCEIEKYQCDVRHYKAVLGIQRIKYDDLLTQLT